MAHDAESPCQTLTDAVALVFAMNDADFQVFQPRTTSERVACNLCHRAARGDAHALDMLLELSGKEPSYGWVDDVLVSIQETAQNAEAI